MMSGFGRLSYIFSFSLVFLRKILIRHILAPEHDLIGLWPELREQNKISVVFLLRNVEKLWLWPCYGCTIVKITVLIVIPLFRGVSGELSLPPRAFFSIFCKF